MEENNLQTKYQGFNKEVRFAVVMYGGVSLAIYINGVAQELLKMCRATKNDAKNLDSTEKLFRQIGVILANEELSAKLLNQTDFTKIDDEIKQSVDENSPTVKFVVDILTGTSAGGINAIFLAKALANNQDISSLKKMWIEQGDIGVLINDKKSVADNDLDAPVKAKSLLNSDRMFIELIKAFEGMDDVAGGEPLVDEIDLFVPTTDFKGVIVPLRLLDGIIEEKSYRQAFHFRFDKSDKEKDENGRETYQNDFTKDHNSMLAFASRATSSFPFAFEPMRLNSALGIIRQCFEDGSTKAENLAADCERFFPYIVEKNGEKVEWENRDLIDGGVLDNKPISHAISVLSQRRADFQVERKLLYIEPSPESFNNKNRQNSDAPPDVLENAVASLSSIPGYETIREDLEKLFERNRLIERVNSIICFAEEDVFQQLTTLSATKLYVNKNEKESGDWWATQGLEDIAELKGRAVLSYYRLRIAALTDEITRLATKIIGVDENSEYFAAVRDLIKTWRTTKYKDYKNQEKEPETDQKKEPETVLGYLRNYDLIYRLRRLRFAQQKLSRLYFFDKDFSDEIKKRHDRLKTIRTEKETKTKAAQNAEKITENPFVEGNIKIPINISEDLQDRLNLTETDRERKPSEILHLVGGNSKENKYQIQIQKSAEYFLIKFGEVYKKLQKNNKNLQNLSENGLKKEKETKKENLSKEYQFFEELKKIGEKFKKGNSNPESGNTVMKQLLDVTERNSEKVNTEKIKQSDIWESFGNDITSASKKLEEYFYVVFKQARETVNKLLETDFQDLPDKTGLEDVEPIIFNAVRGYLCHYYNNFDEYDQMSYPIFYQTQVGEAVKVDVMRISPIDAPSLINLSDPKEKRQKVAGESLFHFGAFLDGTWRWNDIMWGRLDGAERLITALMPDKKYEHLRAYFTKKMHLEILNEEFQTANLKQLKETLAESVAKTSSGLDFREVIGKITQKYSDDAVKTSLESILKTLFSSEEEVYEFVKSDYKFEEKTEPKQMLEVISRSTKVTGDIFEGIADSHGIKGDKFRLVSRLGQIFWGLVEVAAPNSIWNMLLGHWLVLLYFFEVLLIIASTLLVKTEIQQFGTVLLVLTLILHLSAVTLHDYMRGGNFLYLLRFFAVGILAILIGSGALSFYAFFYDASIWNKLTYFQGELTKLERWQKLIPLSLLVTLILVVFTWRDSKNPRIRFYGGITLIYVGLAVISGVIMGWLAQGAQTIDNPKPIMSLEFVYSVTDVQKLAGDIGSIARVGLKQALLVDSFIFVPLYTAFLLFYSGLFNLWKKNLQNWKRALITISVGCIFAAAFSDLTENYFSYLVLTKPISNTEEWQVKAIYYAAMAKWFLIAFTTGILSLMFWRKNWWKLFTFAFIATAIIGFVGLFENQHQFIGYFLMMQISVLIVNGILFLIYPNTFKREHL